jgi:hypothetical protein
MSAHTDVTQGVILYPPESIPEAFVTASVSANGDKIGEYSKFDPLFLALQNVVTSPGTNIDTIVSGDDRGEILRMHGAGMKDYRIGEEEVHIMAKRNLTITQQTMSGGAESNIVTRYNVTMRKPSVLSRLRAGEKQVLSSDEKSVLDSKNLVVRDNAGLLPHYTDLLGDKILDTFKAEDCYLYTEPVSLPIIAAGETVLVGSPIEPPQGYVGVLLGVSVDANSIRTTVPGFPLLRDTFIRINRLDKKQYNLVQLDTAAMPGMVAGTTWEMTRMYLPTTKKIEVTLYSATGLPAGFDCKIMYGIRPITTIDKLMWSEFYHVASTELDTQAISTLRVNEIVAAGTE